MLGKVVVTGGAGFIGSHFARQLAIAGAAEVVVYDALTYAGDKRNLLGAPQNLHFVKGDIADAATLSAAIYDCDAIVSFAAETHVDRSIVDAAPFVHTNIDGMRVLLEAVRDCGVPKLVHVSTDEVYGSVLTGHASENAPLRPSNPYSATKAAADLLALSYHSTYGIHVSIVRGTNTYGPRQYPEKLIPLFVTNALMGKSLPIYGDGSARREWLHVADHAAAVRTVLAHGEAGEVYNAAGESELSVHEVAQTILRILDSDPALIVHVGDRPGHDSRYSLDDAKLKRLGWTPCVQFAEGLPDTVRWYEDNSAWWGRIRDGGQFAEWERRWYSDRSHS